MQANHSVPRHPRPEFVRRLEVESLEDRRVLSASPLLSLAVDLQALPVVGTVLDVADVNVEATIAVESGLLTPGEGAPLAGLGLALEANVAEAAEVSAAVEANAVPSGPAGQGGSPVLGAAVEVGVGETGGGSVGVELSPNGDNAVAIDLGDGPDAPALPPETPAGGIGGLLGQGGGQAGSGAAAEAIPTPPAPVVTAFVPTPAPVDVLAEGGSAASGSVSEAVAPAEDLSGSAAGEEDAAVAAVPDAGTLDRVFALSSGGEAVAVEAAPADAAPGLVTEFAPGDGAGLDAAFLRLLDDMNDLGQEVGEMLLSREVALWLLTSAAAALACQAYGRRRRTKGKKPPHESGLSARKALSGSAGFTPVVG